MEKGSRSSSTTNHQVNMSSFASLMALSASNTRASQTAAETLLADRKRREAEARKAQLEREKKDKEREAMLRKRHFEELQKEEERKRKREEERKKMEEAMEKKKMRDRDALLYGPTGKKGGKVSSSSSSTPSSRKAGVDNDEDDDGPKSEPLTREELRERKLQAELRKQFSSAKRSSMTGSYQKAGRRLPGGAVDVTTNGPPSASATASGSSVKARLSALPNTLTRLNTVKRDTRTIDEILQDRAKAKEMKTLDGEEALAFDDWFGSKRKDKEREKSRNPASGESTPTPKSNRATGTPPIPSSSSGAKKSLPTKPIPKLSSSSSKSAPSTSTSSSRPSKPSTSASTIPKKRPRSPTHRSESPPRHKSKRRAVSVSRDYFSDYSDYDSVSDDEGHSRRSNAKEKGPDIKGLIWDLMGKKRSDYVNRDVFSDDEDMEVGASILEREEKRSARLAKEEDLKALEEEKRHEDEKKRRKIGMRG